MKCQLKQYSVGINLLFTMQRNQIIINKKGFDILYFIRLNFSQDEELQESYLVISFVRR
ncbi:unnamed protein product [Paramecium sonneborni]|uniref:Uncharacterized protein n=1 Tax=Paramecium sonneborni TaxID=65129 RepID=A0A8S1NRA3_9CILI|nr:unnamed protein product [Paramecium sonneborni]